MYHLIVSTAGYGYRGLISQRGFRKKHPVFALIADNTTKNPKVVIGFPERAAKHFWGFKVNFSRSCLSV